MKLKDKIATAVKANEGIKIPVLLSELMPSNNEEIVREQKLKFSIKIYPNAIKEHKLEFKKKSIVSLREWLDDELKINAYKTDNKTPKKPSTYPTKTTLKNATIGKNRFYSLTSSLFEKEFQNDKPPKDYKTKKLPEKILKKLKNLAKNRYKGSIPETFEKLITCNKDLLVLLLYRLEYKCKKHPNTLLWTKFLAPSFMKNYKKSESGEALEDDLKSIKFESKPEVVKGKGIYFFMVNEEIKYVGKASNFLNEWSSYKRGDFSYGVIGRQLTRISVNTFLEKAFETYPSKIKFCNVSIADTNVSQIIEDLKKKKICLKKTLGSSGKSAKSADLDLLESAFMFVLDENSWNSNSGKKNIKIGK
jgi:hypothetical protein